MKISVIGTGYVGLVTGTCFADMGNQVVCVDNNQQKLEMLKNEIVPIYEPGLEKLFKSNIEKKRLSFTNNLKKAVLESEFVFLCLPTPQDEDGSADLKYVLGVSDDIGKILKENGDKDFKIIINKSTVPVGTSRKTTEIIAKHEIKNFEVISNPEFLREGFAVEDFMRPERVVVGVSSEYSRERLKALYEPFVRQGNPILFMDPQSSEVTKYAANSFLATKITFMNELANFCEIVGANVDLVRIGMGTDSRIGKRFLFPGIGYGGSCFPKDVNALIKTAEDNNSPMTLLKQVDLVNKNQKSVLVEKIISHYGNNLVGKQFAVWGLAFKPNTDDMREAPSITILNKLLEAGAKILAYDPASMETSKHYFGDRIIYTEEQYDVFENSDALLVLTEWNEFRNPDFNLIFEKLKDKVIFDGRNVYSPEEIKGHGFAYYSIGRKAIN